MSVNVSYKGTVHSYGVSRTMLVENLKEEISEKQYLYQFKLMLDQAELLDQKPVIKYLFTSFTLCYDDKEAAVEINDITWGVAVFVPEDQKVFTEKATPEMTVGQLKQMISRKLSSTQGKCTLKKDGKEVPDGDLLKTHLEMKTFTVNMQDIRVVITHEGTSYSITTRSDMTMLEFKRLCASKVKNLLNDFDLLFNGEMLNTDPEYVNMKTTSEGRQAIREIQNNLLRTLASFGIRNGDMILISKTVCRDLPCDQRVNWFSPRNICTTQ